MFPRIAALLLVILSTFPLFASTKITYSILLVGNRAGVQSTEVLENGETSCSNAGIRSPAWTKFWVEILPASFRAYMGLIVLFFVTFVVKFSF